MNFRPFWFALDKAARRRFADRVQSTEGHLNNVAYGYRPAATDLAVAIERESAQAVTRPELRPSDYWKHWPDLPAPTLQEIAMGEVQSV